MTIDDVITALENENAKLMNRIFDLEAEKEALIAGQETLQKALAEKNAEIERKGKILNSYALQYGTVTDQSKKIQEIRTEAIKEFAEEFEKRCIARCIYPAVTKNILKNLVKELTEVKDDEDN